MTERGRDTLLDITASHEAGHAVMRWLLGLPAGAISIDMAQPGNGLCEGTGKVGWLTPRERALFNVAGVVAETGAICKLDPAGCHSDDLDRARREIDQYPEFFMTIDKTDKHVAYVVHAQQTFPSSGNVSFVDQSVDDALGHVFDAAGELLFQHWSLVEWLSEVLRDQAVVSARRVAAICREYGKGIRTERLATVANAAPPSE